MADNGTFGGYGVTGMRRLAAMYYCTEIPPAASCTYKDCRVGGQLIREDISFYYMGFHVTVSAFDDASSSRSASLARITAWSPMRHSRSMPPGGRTFPCRGTHTPHHASSRPT